MDQALEDELLNYMKQSMYLLTSLYHRSIEKTKNGYIGFQISKGLWYKLRVFLLKNEGENKSFKMIYVKGFNQGQKAKDKMHELQQQYQLQ